MKKQRKTRARKFALCGCIGASIAAVILVLFIVAEENCNKTLLSLVLVFDLFILFIDAIFLAVTKHEIKSSSATIWITILNLPFAIVVIFGAIVAIFTDGDGMFLADIIDGDEVIDKSQDKNNK